MSPMHLSTSELNRPIRRVVLPIQEFIHTETSGGLVLLACTVVALTWANVSPGTYASAWETHAAVRLGPWSVDLSLRHWINDGLMALFFLLVGLEIKRELLVGELSSARKAALPVAAAVGGMAVPALLFLAVAGGTNSARGWGIPMATDIAFALGILALLGRRIPTSLKVFLAALAIADDLGAVAVIAIFYSKGLDMAATGAAAGLFAVLLASNALGIRNLIWYCTLGFLLWLAVLHSGVHATVAGVMLALCLPAWSRLDLPRFQEEAGGLIERIHSLESRAGGVLAHQRLLSLVVALEKSCERLEPPLHRLEHALSRWVAMAIMPLFALANAGVAFTTVRADVLAEPLLWGIILGLVAGKPIGIVVGALAAVRLGLASLPRGIGWSHLWGVGFLGGIGFTMSLFVAGLAVGEGPRLDTARMAILAASTVAGTAGYALLRWSVRDEPDGAPDEGRPD